MKKQIFYDFLRFFWKSFTKKWAGNTGVTSETTIPGISSETTIPDILKPAPTFNQDRTRCHAGVPPAHIRSANSVWVTGFSSETTIPEISSDLAADPHPKINRRRHNWYWCQLSRLSGPGDSFQLLRSPIMHKTIIVLLFETWPSATKQEPGAILNSNRDSGSSHSR